MQVRKEISSQVQQSRDKFLDQQSVDHENSGKKKHKKKHKRRNSISGFPTTNPVTVNISSSISSQQPALSSKHRFSSTENLHRLSYTPEKDVSSSSYMYGGVTSSLLPSDKPTLYKPTIRRWSSYGDVRQSSSSSHHSDMSTKRYTSRTNQSSVTYNIISNK